MKTIEQQGLCAKKASEILRLKSTLDKNNALSKIAEALENNKKEILEENAIDIKKAIEDKKTDAFIDRLKLTTQRIDDIINSIYDVIKLPDPIGKINKMERRPNGLQIGRQSVPLGVIAIIYESRPNVTVDAAVLCLKSGNAVILRGGKEAFNSNNAFVNIMRKALVSADLPMDCISLIQDTSRQSVDELLDLIEYIDVVIPRGGAGLIDHVVQNSKIPVIETGVGVCHVYVESIANLKMAADIIFNAKCRRVSVCNAAETLLVDESAAGEFLPMAKELLDIKNVEIRGCAKTISILGECVVPAKEDDYNTEYLDYIISVKVVKNIDEAISHIQKYGTHHSDAIITEDYTASHKFLNEVDSAAVYVNASTAFTDGGEFGLGAEIGISTQKMHARGPMGLSELTASKFIIYGNGQIR